MSGSLAQIGATFGLLQQKGSEMIDLIGPIRVFRGGALDLRLTVVNEDGARTDLTGVAIEIEVKQALGGADPAPISKSIGSGITLLTQSGDTLGQADIAIASTDTNLTPGLYWIDVVTITAGKRVHVREPREFTVLPVVNGP